MLITISKNYICCHTLQSMVTQCSSICYVWFPIPSNCYDSYINYSLSDFVKIIESLSIAIYNLYVVITKSSFVSPSLSPLNMSTQTSTGSNVVSLSTFAFFFFCFLYVNVECSLIIHVGDCHALGYDVDATYYQHVIMLYFSKVFTIGNLQCICLECFQHWTSYLS